MTLFLELFSQIRRPLRQVGFTNTPNFHYWADENPQDYRFQLVSHNCMDVTPG
jgi:hypothetical protein